MTARSFPVEVVQPIAGDEARSRRPVSSQENRTSDLVARLIQITQDLTELAADVVVTLHAPPVPVVVQAAPSSEERVSWTVAEFAKAHGLNKGTVYKLIKDGELRAGRINESLRIAESERLRWWAKCEQRHAAETGLAS